MTESRSPLPPFTHDTAVQKVRGAENGWNTCNPELVSHVYTEDSYWRNRSEFLHGRSEIVRNFRVVGYSFPNGSCAAYYPETNPLVPLYARAPLSFTPSYKGIPIRLERSAVSSGEADTFVDE